MSNGLQKRQLILILLALSLPLILNAVGIWRDVGTTSLLKMWNGTYPDPFLGFLGGPYNPLPGIFEKLLLFVAMLGFLVWLVAFMANKAFFQKQRLIVKLCESVLIASLTAIIFSVASGFFMPLVWLPEFHDYQLGLPVSPFMMACSQWVIFPATAIIMLGALMLSRNKSLENNRIGKTVNAL